jgi:hypothetical protein
VFAYDAFTDELSVYANERKSVIRYWYSFAEAKRLVNIAMEELDKVKGHSAATNKLRSDFNALVEMTNVAGPYDAC